MSLLSRELAVLALACMSPLAHASEADLIALTRQLEGLERQSERSAALAAANTAPTSSRYHFDYVRLQQDLRRIHDGIHDHLTPIRAQPRDPIEIQGDYRREFPDQEAL